MPLPAPYYRIARPFLGVDFHDRYHLRDPRYASDRRDLIRGYHHLEKDLLAFFEAVEPADENLPCFSHRLYALLLRAATEFETNAKAILTANGYTKRAKWNISDYHKLNQAMRLAEYRVTIPFWASHPKTFEPFARWQHGHTLPWYQDYNTVKHHRSSHFGRATFENVLTAVCGVFAIVFAQFEVDAFVPYQDVMQWSQDKNKFSHSDCMFEIETPTSWTADEQYQFEWKSIKALEEQNGTSPFQRFAFEDDGVGE